MMPFIHYVKNTKSAAHKTVTLTVYVNESLPASLIFSFLCELQSVFVSLLRLVVFVLLALPEALPDKEFKFSASKASAITFFIVNILYEINERNKPVCLPLLCVFFLLLLS